MRNEPALTVEQAEDLRWQASRGAELGQKLCACEGHFHKLWGTLRASGFHGGQQSEERELTQAIGALIRDETRILICGAADLGSLTTIGRIANPHKPDVTIIDNCQAPLALIDEVVQRGNVKCRTLHENICDLDGSTRWDLIFMHYLIPFIAPDSYARFFEGVRSSLASGGHLIYVAQVSDKKFGYAETAEVERNWYKNARAVLDASQLSRHWDSAELDAMLRRYAKARAMRIARNFSRTETHDLLSRAGFQVLQEAIAVRHKMSPSDAVTGIESSIILNAVCEP